MESSDAKGDVIVQRRSVVCNAYGPCFVNTGLDMLVGGPSSEVIWTSAFGCMCVCSYCLAFLSAPSLVTFANPDRVTAILANWTISFCCLVFLPVYLEEEVCQSDSCCYRYQYCPC